MITIDEGVWAGDLMNRSGIAKFLTNHLDSVDDIKVLNINAPWGAGKTFFVEKWCAQIKQTRACVYFNAWQHDYTGDAFVSLSAVLHEELSKQLHAPDIAADMATSFSRKASRAIIAATPLLAKGIFKKAVGVGLDEIGKSIELDDAAEAAESIVESLITNNKKVIESVVDFKCALSHMASSASVNASMKNDQPKSPVYIFIDELDRCRPTFAIELLERIKHFFDVENCKFIIATDKQQLACSVKAVYGESFDSERYLRRFFDAEYMLDSTDISKWVKANVDFGINATTDGISGKNLVADHFNDFINPDKRAVLSGELDLNPQQIVVLAVAKTFKLSLRDLQKTLRHVMAVRNNVARDFNILLAFYLVCLREEAVVLYSQVVGESVSDEAWSIIKDKYPSFYLYTEYENLDIHDFIRGVLGHFHMSNQEIRAKINSSTSANNDFSKGFYRAFRDNIAEIKTYPALAELAHSLE